MRQGVPPSTPGQPGMAYMSRAGMLKHLRNVFIGQLSFSLSPGVFPNLSSYHSIIHSPLGFPSERSTGKLFWSFIGLNPSPPGSEPEQCGSVGPAQPECFGLQASAVKGKGRKKK